MGKSGLFIFCLGFSVFVHAVLFMLAPYQASALSPPSARIPEISYQGTVIEKNEPPPPDLPQEPIPKSELSEKSLERVKEFLAQKFDAVDDFIKAEILKTERPQVHDKETPFKRVVNLPNIPGEIARSPEYKSYYQIIRERIRRLAYYNYRKLEEGEVFLTFSISAQGELLELTINEGKSTSSSDLREIALKSVRDAAPYPAFPEKMRQSAKLSFNVIISFELK